jgi:hypothetical protein
MGDEVQTPSWKPCLPCVRVPQGSVVSHSSLGIDFLNNALPALPPLPPLPPVIPPLLNT